MTRPPEILTSPLCSGLPFARRHQPDSVPDRRQGPRGTACSASPEHRNALPASPTGQRALLSRMEWPQTPSQRNKLASSASPAGPALPPRAAPPTLSAPPRPARPLAAAAPLLPPLDPAIRPASSAKQASRRRPRAIRSLHIKAPLRSGSHPPASAGAARRLRRQSIKPAPIPPHPTPPRPIHTHLPQQGSTPGHG